MSGKFGTFMLRVHGSVKYYVHGLYKNIVEEDVLFLSSGLAFNTLICAIPLLLLLTWALGMILQSAHFPIQKVDDALNAIFPPQPYAQQIKSSIKDTLSDIVRYRFTVRMVGHCRAGVDCGIVVQFRPDGDESNISFSAVQTRLYQDSGERHSCYYSRRFILHRQYFYLDAPVDEFVSHGYSAFSSAPARSMDAFDLVIYHVSSGACHVLCDESLYPRQTSIE